MRYVVGGLLLASGVLLIAFGVVLWLRSDPTEQPIQKYGRGTAAVALGVVCVSIGLKQVGATESEVPWWKPNDLNPGGDAPTLPGSTTSG